ncbi:MAG TPA: acyl-CoA-binding protein [Jiangellales bacterium]|nr:acyl-CoA-binding protein [Jiangellales bacterium]
MADDLNADFDQAVAEVSALTTDPGNDAKLRLYALYKQATVGDVQGKRPGFTNPVGRAKHDAWAAVSGTAADDAKRQYVELARGLAG